MKKIALILISFFTLLVVLTYTLAFTQMGNNLLKPTIESKINASSPVPIKLKEFTLTTKTLRVLIELDASNSILAYGSYSLFTQTFDINYELKLTKLSTLSKLAQRKLSGKFFSNGKVLGDLDNFYL